MYVMHQSAKTKVRFTYLGLQSRRSAPGHMAYPQCGLRICSSGHFDPQENDDGLLCL